METKKQVNEISGIRNTSSKGHWWKTSRRTPIDADLIRSKNRFQSDDSFVAFFSPVFELYPSITLESHFKYCCEEIVMPMLKNQAQIEEITNAPTEGIYGNKGNLSDSQRS